MLNLLRLARDANYLSECQSSHIKFDSAQHELMDATRRMTVALVCDGNDTRRRDHNKNLPVQFAVYFGPEVEDNVVYELPEYLGVDNTQGANHVKHVRRKSEDSRTMRNTSISAEMGDVYSDGIDLGSKCTDHFHEPYVAD